MIIDIASHVYPRPVIDWVKRIAPSFGSMGTRVENTPQLYDFDERFRLMDEAGEFGTDCPFGSIRKGLDMMDRLATRRI